MYETLILSIFPLMIVIAGIRDFFTFQIPNWINVVIAVSVLPFVILSNMPMELFAWHILAGIVTFIVCLFLFSFQIIGGGDAKMLSACAIWVGWDSLVIFATQTAFAGMGLIIAIFVWRYFSDINETRGMEWAGKLLARRPQLPYGIAIAAGGIAVFPYTWWVQQMI